MQQEIRQRKAQNSPTNNTMPRSSPKSNALSAPRMLEASPQHYEYVMKLRIPALFSILPRFLQKIVCRFSCLRFLAPSWERRFLILLGGFLYRFTDDKDPTKEPKGTPMAIESVDINLLQNAEAFREEDAALAFDLLPPPGCKAAFCLSTLRKRHYYATVTVEDAETWVNALRQARDEAIKRKMGHAPGESYPPQWTHYDHLGKSWSDRKDRIRQRLQESSVRELELSNITDGAAAPRGYYG